MTEDASWDTTTRPTTTTTTATVDHLHSGLKVDSLYSAQLRVIQVELRATLSPAVGQTSDLQPSRWSIETQPLRMPGPVQPRSRLKHKTR